MAGTRLTRTPSADGNLDKFTISLWFKRCKLGSQQKFLFAGDSGSNQLQVLFHNDDQLQFEYYDGSYNYKIKTNRKFRDTSAWYHLVVVWDTGNATSGDRMIFYVNGTRETSFASEAQPTQNLDGFWNDASYTNYIGSGPTQYFDGLMSHIHLTDGYVYDASAFGSTDATTGEWKINTSPTVTYGTNGFFILKDGNSVTDQSGNSNNFTVATGTLTNSEDCPSNVFATYNPLNTDRSLSNGNLTVVTTAANFYGASATLGDSSGKYYWEVKLDTSTYQFVGVDYNPSESFRNNQSSGTAHSYLIYAGNGSIYNNGVVTSYGTAYSQGDIVGVAMDLDNSKLYFSKNGTWQNSADPASGTGGFSLTANQTYFPVIGDGASAYGATSSTNFGNGYFGTTAISSEGTNASNIGKFEYDVPTGYTALSTKGLNE